MWIPEEQYGIKAMPPFPNCGMNDGVARHDWNSTHVGRSYVATKKTKYVMGPRYLCPCCRNKSRAFLDAKNAESNMNSDAEHETESDEVPPTYTFMAWNAKSLPLIWKGLGEEFPAILTHKSGLCKDIATSLRPLFDRGVRPEALANLILEYHTLEHTRQWILYEREVEAKLAAKLDADYKPDMFSTFTDR